MGAGPIVNITFPMSTVQQFVEHHTDELRDAEIFLRAREPLPLGLHAWFDLKLANGDPLWRGWATVVAVRHRNGGRPGMVVRFEKLGPRSRAVLRSLSSETTRRRQQRALEASAWGTRDTGAGECADSELFGGCEASSTADFLGDYNDESTASRIGFESMPFC